MNSVEKKESPSKWQKAIKAAGQVFAGVIVVLLVLYFGRSHILNFAVQKFFEHYVVNTTEEQKKEFYSHLAQNMPGGIFEAVPEPDVGRVLQFNVERVSQQATIVTNLAGMRSSRQFEPKSDKKFRIICLGDSMVMGTAGKEQDRWGNQIEEILSEHKIEVDGKAIEVYSIGVEAWTLLNSTTYLSHRLSDYEPDLVLLMIVMNDFSDNPGVMGIGQVTFQFSPEKRHLGSGVLSDHWPVNLGTLEANHLYAGLGPESKSRWEKSFRSMKRLEQLLEERGVKLLVGALEGTDLYPELIKHYYAVVEMNSPLIMTGYFNKQLPHDPHPSREGHQILANHFLHVLAELQWLPIENSVLADLPADLSLNTEWPPDPEAIASLQRELIQAKLPREIQFHALSHNDRTAILGGIFLGKPNQPGKSYPYGTIKSVFLLRKKPAAAFVDLEIMVPDRPELYPFELVMSINGQAASTVALQHANQHGQHQLSGKIPQGNDGVEALEISLQATSYWAEMHDFTMKSYQMISVSQR